MAAVDPATLDFRPARPLPAHQRLLNSTPVAILLYVLVMYLIIRGSYIGAERMGYNWQWYQIPRYFYTLTDDGFRWGEIPRGLMVTIYLSGLSFLLSVGIGLVVALLRLSDLIVGRGVSIVFLELIRNIPLLVLLYLFYYVLGPIFGWSRFTASVLTLAVFHGALVSEILRAGINAVPVGQWEAAKSIGMSGYQTYRYIVLPQSIRIMLPPMTGEFVHLIKSSAIVSVIAVAELTTIGRNIISHTFMSFEVWFTVAAVYMVLTLTLSIGVTYLERKYAVDR